MNTMNLDTLKEKGLRKLVPGVPRIAFGMGTCGIGNGSATLYNMFQSSVKKAGIKAILVKTGCFGFCSEEPLVNVYVPGHPMLILHKITENHIETIINAIVEKKPEKLKKYILCKISSWNHHTASFTYGNGFPDIPEWNEIPFYRWQKKIVLRNCGIINPEDIDEYCAAGGYETLGKVLVTVKPEKVIEELKTARLRGRGGAGFPTWKKWEIMKSEKSDKKYIICNAEEGDPGAYMNRNELEGDPHMVIEGMIIGAYTMGAHEGIIYILAEYPTAIKRLNIAVKQAKKAGILGKNIFNSGFDFDIHIVEGAGAYVCGEETALIRSVEGIAGRPIPRPPFPSQKGLYGKPTTINNVETWANIPVILARGGSWFSKTGTDKSAGTKVFSLVGKIKNTGLVELPLGETLETIVYRIGEGSVLSKGNKNGSKKRIKAIQTGGPAGGCIPSRLFKTRVDYESLASLGSIMGSGGLVVMDEDNCMVDIARYFAEFLTWESCGKCVPCREGLYQILLILNRITDGHGTLEDLKELEDLGMVIKDTALCGLGQAGPNPILTTLKYFKSEYEQHIIEKRCDSGVCAMLSGGESKKD
jgi:NADH-quinone oxidoreductase subunit F